MMFMQPDQKQETLKFDANAPIFCPTDADRITTLWFIHSLLNKRVIVNFNTFIDVNMVYGAQ